MAVKYDDSYLDFYAAYPRKEGKADGFKAWNNISRTDQALALADVKKRLRAGAYSSNKKLIQLPASYLRARRWEDDWEATLESSRKGDDTFVSRGAYVPPVKAPEDTTPWQERLINRLFLAYVLELPYPHKLPEVETALKLKYEVLRECEVLRDEPKAEQAETIAALYCDRMDAAYGLKAGERALRAARARRERWSKHEKTVRA